LTNELAEAKRDLEKQERALKEFKEQHMGALPEQMTTNLHTLDRLQLEYQTITDSLKSAEDRMIFYQTRLSEYEKQLAGMASGAASPLPLATQLRDMKQELS